MELIKGYFVDPFDEEDDDDIENVINRRKGMRKMTEYEEKKFPGIVADSIRCMSYHIARFEKCDGCDFAVTGCEKVFHMCAS